MINWKDVAIGSATTLVVTVLGGVALFYLTKEPAPSPRAEQLMYETQHLGEFQSQSTRVALQSIRVMNSGNLAANQVRAAVDYPQSVKIVDKVASLSSGPAGTFTINSATSNRLDLVIPSLAPGESLTVSVLLYQSVKSLPDISVKSDASIGKRAELTQLQSANKRGNLEETGKWLMPVLLVLQLPLALYFSRRFIRRFNYSRSLNNTAFALIHQGDATTGLRLLRRAMLQGECGVNEFANRALCLALAGDTAGAKQSLAAAELFDKGARNTEVIAFN